MRNLVGYSNVQMSRKVYPLSFIRYSKLDVAR